jgi:hypothetical protein
MINKKPGQCPGRVKVQFDGAKGRGKRKNLLVHKIRIIYFRGRSENSYYPNPYPLYGD